MTGRLILYPITLAVGMGFFYLMNKLSSRSKPVQLTDESKQITNRVKRIRVMCSYFISAVLVGFLIDGFFYSLRSKFLTGLIAGMAGAGIELVVVAIGKHWVEKKRKIRA